jgi:hypothetical protein
MLSFVFKNRGNLVRCLWFLKIETFCFAETNKNGLANKCSDFWMAVQKNLIFKNHDFLYGIF